MVNTFIPYSDFTKIAKVLDSKRLGKQRVEAKQILNILLGKAKSNAWKNHPAVLMWRGYETALKYYHNVMIDEWKLRGYVNTMRKYIIPKKIAMPWFLYSKPILDSYRANLLRKDMEHYSKYFKVNPIYMKRSYIWISHLNDDQIDTMKNNKKININEYAKKN